MANSLYREKDILKKSTKKFVETTACDYSRYFEGSPAFITYYQLNSEATKQDSSLENVHSLVGPNSPNKYNVINDVCIYGIDPLSVSDEIGEKGLQSLIEGEFVLLPDTIRPYVGDFFVFDYEGLETHLFKIDDVQYDKPSSKKFFQVRFSLYQDNPSLIFDNVIDELAVIYDKESGQQTTVIKKDKAELAENTKKLVDEIIDRYIELFYDDDMDNFSFTTNGTTYWLPYIQKFAYDTNVFNKYNKNLLDEIYIQNITEKEYPEIYNDSAYRSSLFKKVIVQDKCIPFESSFSSLAGYDLKSNRNLPFFNSTVKFKVINLYGSNSNPTFYIDGFHNLFGNIEEPISQEEDYHFFYDQTDLDILNLKNNDLIYKKENDYSKIPIDGVFKINFLPDENGDMTMNAYDVSFGALVDVNEKSKEILKNEILFNIIKDYLNDTLRLDSDLIKKLNNYNYSNNYKTYYLTPMVIYIIKDLIDKSIK